tara:strand:- start:46 stop:219 length:174 start_codon:yes stop_codon:yes gene_type:complete
MTDFAKLTKSSGLRVNHDKIKQIVINDNSDGKIFLNFCLKNKINVSFNEKELCLKKV